MHQFRKLEILVGEDQKEIVLAFLGTLSCDIMEETPEGWRIYLEKNADFETNFSSFQNIIERFELEYTQEDVEPQNWNEVWESSFQPIYVNDFCQIRASFHDSKPGYKYDLIIDPKMSFGTGHHATTYMMVDQMSLLNLEDKTVMDYGCGTGILAILAAKMNCARVVAFDIEENAAENTISNFKENQVSTPSQIFCGTLQDVNPNESPDCIVANINRNVLMDSMDKLYNLLVKSGTLLLSGILLQDRDLIEKKATESGFTLLQTQSREGWMCIKLTK